MIVLRRSGLLAFALAIHVCGNGRDDDHALDDVLVIDVDAEKREPALAASLTSESLRPVTRSTILLFDDLVKIFR